MKIYAEIVSLLLMMFVLVYNRSFAIESSRGHRFLSKDHSDLRRLRPGVVKYNRVVIVLVGMILVGLLVRDLVSTVVSPVRASQEVAFSWILFAFLIVWSGTAVGGVIFFLRRRATSLEDAERDQSEEAS